MSQRSPVFSRRSFLKTTGLASAWLTLSPSRSGYRQERPGIETDVVIYGGGASGVCAAIQAARLGASVVVIEPTPWLGGMLTAAGVSALDGNKYGLGAGLVGEFRNRLIAHYGSEEALFSGWVSLTCYEPHVGERFLRDLAAAEPGIQVLFEADVIGYERTGPHERRVLASCPDGRIQPVVGSVFIDCSEYGDGLELAGVPYRLGREGRDELGESAAPEAPDLKMQDLTYVAILQRDPSVEPGPGEPNAAAYWDLFRCSTLGDCPDPDPERLNHTVHDWKSFITYGMLPGGAKVMLNWPHHANDFPVTPAYFLDRYYRKRHNAAARLHTLEFVRYLRDGLGHREWSLAADEYPTEDQLPFIPYIRESRRMVNQAVMTQDEVVARNGNPRAPMQEDAIAVGDYFLDHHHAEHHLPPGERLVEDYPDSAPFQVPMRVCLPSNGDPCFLAGEKNLAVSHIVNGSTRLQPVVMLIGQALGAVAAHAVRRGVTPADVPVREVQLDLIDAGAQIYPVYDLYREDAAFAPVQRLALMGVLNETDPVRLEPGARLSGSRASAWLARVGLESHYTGGEGEETVERSDFIRSFRRSLPDGRGPVTRGDFLVALEATAAPLLGFGS